MRLSCVKLLIATIASPLMAGCWGGVSDPSRPAVIPTTVTVRFKNEPVAEARVYFSFQGGGRGASGLTDGTGVARMTTFEPEDGVVPGMHSVKIEKVQEDVKVSDKKIPDSNDFEVSVTRKALLPAVYSDYKSSGLSAEVKPEGENAFVFQLTGEVGSK